MWHGDQQDQHQLGSLVHTQNSRPGPAHPNAVNTYSSFTLKFLTFSRFQTLSSEANFFIFLSHCMIRNPQKVLTNHGNGGPVQHPIFYEHGLVISPIKMVVPAMRFSYSLFPRKSRYSCTDSSQLSCTAGISTLFSKVPENIYLRPCGSHSLSRHSALLL